MTALPSSAASQEAAAWFTRLHKRSVTVTELRAFRAWRRQGDNDAAYAEVEAAWLKLDAVAADPEIQAATQTALNKPLPRATVSWSPIPKPGAALLGALLLATAAGGAWLVAGGQPGEAYATRVGEQRLVTLPDGSRVRLNTGSEVRVRFGAHRRDLTLARGEAFFEVAHDAGRPFTVTAGPAAVRAVGTRFDVFRDGAAVKVTLVEGKVDVRRDGGDSTTLLPDQQLTVTAGATTRPAPADRDRATGWTTGRLTFRAEPLSAALAEVNRYTDRPIVLDAPALAQRPVSGVFNAGDTRAFATAVGVMLDLDETTDARGATHLAPHAAPTGG